MAAWHGIRERKAKERTALANQARALLMEQGLIVAKGIRNIRKFLPLAIENLENGVSMTARDYLPELYAKLVTCDELIEKYESRITAKVTDIVGFIRHLLAHVSGKIFVAWDGCPIHRSKEVKKFLPDEADGRVWLERLPVYCPDLNTDEGVWNYLKRVCLRNRIFSN